jgi:hypothetical protein
MPISAGSVLEFDCLLVLVAHGQAPEAKGPAPFITERAWAARPNCIACGK